METEQNKDIDFSDYSAKTPLPSGVVAPPDIGKEERKKKIQIIIVVAGFILTAAFWGYYFYGQNAKNQPSNYDISGEMIPE
ncbi:MAG TPA: hypothetical protein PLA19_04690 [Candidatus Pacearchaeota archaeon]|nr:hypothetical protein [Candidatus Pacearchaeota archaeon]